MEKNLQQRISIFLGENPYFFKKKSKQEYQYHRKNIFHHDIHRVEVHQFTGNNNVSGPAKIREEGHHKASLNMLLTSSRATTLGLLSINRFTEIASSASLSKSFSVTPIWPNVGILTSRANA